MLLWGCLAVSIATLPIAIDMPTRPVWRHANLRVISRNWLAVPDRTPGKSNRLKTAISAGWIGTRPGTGGSSGAGYLATTLMQPLFPDLWAIRARL